MGIGWEKRFWIALAGVFGAICLVVLGDRFRSEHILRTEEIPATVLSVTTNHRLAWYLVEFPDGHTRMLNGSSLRLHPAGSTLMVSANHLADGTTEFRLPRPPY